MKVFRKFSTYIAQTRLQMRQTNRHLVVELREYIEGLPKISNVAQIRLQKRHGGSRGSHCPSRSNKTGCRYVELIRLHIRVNCMELRWRQPCSDPVAPCFIKRREERKRKKEKFYIYLDVTHTHKQIWLKNI